MKQIVAIVKPYLAEKLIAALQWAPLEALTVREVKGYGRQKDYLDRYDEGEFSVAFLPKVEITAYVEDDRAAEVAKQLTAVARTGRHGDGKIFLLAAPRCEVF